MGNSISPTSDVNTSTKRGAVTIPNERSTDVRLVPARISGTALVGRATKTIDTDLCFCLISVKLTPPLARTLTEQNSEWSG